MNLNCMGNSVNARLNPRSVLKPRLSREPTEQLGTRRAHFSVQSCSLWIICINASPTLTCQFAFGDDPASGPHGILGICLSVTCRVWFQRASRRKALSRHVCKCLSASERSHSPVAARQWGGFSGMHRPHQTRLDLRASKGGDERPTVSGFKSLRCISTENKKNLFIFRYLFWLDYYKCIQTIYSFYFQIQMIQIKKLYLIKKNSIKSGTQVCKKLYVGSCKDNCLKKS